MDRGSTDRDHSKSKGKGKVMTYYYCDKECHFKKDCPKRKDLAKEEESKSNILLSRKVQIAR